MRALKREKLSVWQLCRAEELHMADEKTLRGNQTGGRMEKRNLTNETIKAIETVISKGDRAEVVPVKDGVKVLRVSRETIHEQK